MNIKQTKNKKKILKKKINKGLQDIHFTSKGNMDVPAWIAFTNATNWNRLSSENHLIIHVTGLEAVFSSLIAATFLSALAEEQNTDVVHFKATVTHQLSLVSMT